MNIDRKKFERYLIIIDLDGTSLKKDYKTLDPLTKEVLKQLSEQGHIVCIATGKNYPSAIKYYEELGLKTYLITYNGAFTSHPRDYSGDRVKNYFPISNDAIKKIMSEPIIRNNVKEYLVDTIDNRTMSTSQNVYWKQVFNQQTQVTKDILNELGNKDCLQLVLEFDNDQSIFNSIVSKLRNYRTSVYFNYLNKLKKTETETESNEGDVLVHDPNSTVIRIRSALANKGNSAEWISTYYGIPLSKTIAFGDDANDLELIKKAGYGIVMANGTKELKANAHDITKHDNHSGGVGVYLADFFGIDISKFK